MMSHYPISNENQKPEPFGQGDGINCVKNTYGPDDESQRDGEHHSPSKRATDHDASTTSTETGDRALILGLKKLDVNDSIRDREDGEQIEKSATTENDEQSNGANQRTEAGEPASEEDRLFARERQVLLQYLLDNVAEFRDLSEIRLKGWENPEGDRYFERQRHISDNPDEQTSKIFMGMMQRVGAKMQEATGVFTLTSKRPSMLALGCAPGGFVSTALKFNPDVQIIGITLPVRDNGVECLVKKNKRLTLIEADVTMLAADLGTAETDIPKNHPDARNFLPRQIRPRQQFDIVTCEGGVLRTHEIAPYREHREASRLKTSQLAIALARVKPGGSMVVLMHKAEARNSLCLFYIFSKFARVRLFKPDVQHQHRSSFYMIATDIQSQGEAVRRAVTQWTGEWRAATFGTDEEYHEEIHRDHVDIDEVLKEFGEKWVELSREVWKIQIKGLQKKSFAQ
ncbi:Ribosomal RNA large subunit methyltransferase E [Cytospora mali]|uniref:Ribosomal RNA large subunit methyltransferase E n=1 Tax=Cytospora mali TaxID=578113 RepID=A0A194UWA6_CYTMA|nr:Ribosomal RNA large subunit methyltransferase E [Valsa mali var. pyri (nom. inval.)]